MGAIAVAAMVAALLGQPVPASQSDRLLYSPDELAAILRHSPLGPLPSDPTDAVADDPRAAEFGQALFFDPHFSANDKISCASCHQPNHAFTDGRALAKGLGIGTRHT
ncbi:MAG: cytochrome-c peroxidase, partial [Stellaceae bacterium]